MALAFKIFPVFLFLSTYMNGQALRCNRYYKLVYCAEANILKADYKQALNFYDSAISEREIPFAIDVFNASICATKTNDFDKLVYLSRMLVLLGADMSMFDKCCYKEFKRSTQWKCVTDSIVFWKKDRQYDFGLRAILKKYLEIDQQMHCKLADSAHSNDFINQMHTLDDSLAEILSNENEFSAILSESAVGANFSDTILHWYPLCYFLILHNFQRGDSKFLQAIKAAVVDCSLRAEVGLMLIEQAPSSDVIFSFDFSIYRDTLRKRERDAGSYFLKRVVDLMSETDERAAQLRPYFHLDSPSHITNKIVYSTKSSAYILLPVVNTIHSFASEKDEEKYMKFTRVIN